MQFVLGGLSRWWGEYCHPNVCQNGAVCSDDYEGKTYHCHCLTGFYGRDCELCNYSLHLHCVAIYQYTSEVANGRFHVFTALHVMQTRYSDENSVRPPSVRLSVRQTRGL